MVRVRFGWRRGVAGLAHQGLHAVAVDIGYVSGGYGYLTFAGGLLHPLRAQLLWPWYIACYQCLASLADHGQDIALGIGYLSAEWQRAAISQL